MVQKTIAVNVTGEGEIDRISKKISHLRNAVLDVEKKLKAGLSNNPAISLKLKLDASQFKKDFTALKKEIEGSALSVGTKNSKGTGSNTSKNKASKDIVSNVNSLTEDIKKASEKAGISMQKSISESSKDIAKGITKGYTDFSKLLEDEAKKVLSKDSSDLGKLISNKLKYLDTLIKAEEGKLTRTRGLTSKQLGLSTNSSGKPIGIAETSTGKVSFSKDNIVANLRDLYRFEEVSPAVKQKAQELMDKYNNPNFKSPQVQGFTDFLNALEQVKGALDTVNQKLLNFITTSTRLAGLNPFKSFLSGATSLTRAIVNLNTQLGRTAGGAIVGTLRNSFNALRGYGTQAVRSLASETQELGDAMVSYRNNMRAMDLDEDTINRNLKEMGDYGKASVYNAGDLLEMLSTYKAYGLSNDESKELTKAMAGLVSNRSDSNEALGRASKQLNDIFVRGNASTQDLRIMRSWFNPLASAKIQASLEEIAKGKGYSNLQEAIEDRAISAEDTKKAIIELGLTNKTFKDSNGELVNEFQAMVNNIATPRQAIDNLKETLANLFAYDKVTVNEDGTTNVEPGAFGALYNRTAQLIKGMADIAGSDTFEKGVTALGNDLARTIDSVIDFGTKWNVQFSTPFINSLKNFYRGIKEGVDVNGVGDYANNLTRNVIEFNNLYGKKIGEAIGNVVKNGTELLSILSELGKQFVGADGLKILDELGKFFNNLGKVAVDTNAVKALVETYKLFYEGANEVVSSAQNIQGAKGVVESYRNFLYALKDMIVFVGSQTNIVPNALEVVSSFIDMVTGVVTKVRGSVSVREVNQFSNNIKDFFTETMGALEDIYAQIISSAIKAGSSQTGKQFFESVKDFIVSVNEAILSALQALGGGNAQAGIEKIMSYATLILDSLSTIVKTMGEHPLLTGGILVATKFGSVAISVIQVLASVIENMKILSGTSLGGGFLGKLFGGGASGGAGVDGTGLVGGLFSKSWRGKGSQAFSKGWNKFADFAGNAFVGKPNVAITAKNLGTASPYRKGLSVPITQVLGYERTGLFSGKNFNPFKNVSVAGIKQVSNRLVDGMASAKGQLLAMGAVMGTEMVDSFVQNSKAPQWLKDTSNFGRGFANIAGNTASFAGLGSAFGPWGTVIGGGIGLAKGIYDEISRSNSKKAEQQAIKDQAKQQAEEMAKAQNDLMFDQVRQLGENAKYVRDSYIQAIDGFNSQSLQAVTQNLQQKAVESGTTLTKAIQNMGYNVAKVPKNFAEKFVEIDNKLVNLGDLQQAYGLTEQELLGALLELNNATGNKVLEIKDGLGNVTDAVTNFTPEQEAKNQERIQTFLRELSDKTGYLFDKALENVTLPQLEKMQQAIDTAVNGTTYETKSDRINAYKELLKQHLGLTEEQVVNMNAKQAEGLLKTISESIEEVTKTPEERKADLLDQFREKFKGTEEQLKKKTAELMNKSIEEIQQEVDKLDLNTDGDNKEAKGDSKESNTEVSGKIQEMKQAIKTALNKMTDDSFAQHKATIDQALATLNNPTEADETKQVAETTIRTILQEQLGIVDKKIQDAIIQKMTKSKMTLEEALTSLQEDPEGKNEQMETAKTQLKESADKLPEEASKKMTTIGEFILQSALSIAGISTADVVHASEKVPEEVGNTKNKAKDKLNETANASKADFSGIQVGDIFSAVQGIWDAISSTASNALAKLNEIRTSISNKAASFFTGIVGGGNKGPASGGMWAGGLVPAYHKDGDLILPYGVNWKPRATDTVPTMLTPGEFVLRKQAVDSIGVGLLRKMNSQGIRALQNSSSRTIINNIYNNNNAQVTQNVDNKSSYLNSMNGLDRLMRYV